MVGSLFCFGIPSTAVILAPFARFGGMQRKLLADGGFVLAGILVKSQTPELSDSCGDIGETLGQTTIRGNALFPGRCHLAGPGRCFAPFQP